MRRPHQAGQGSGEPILDIGSEGGTKIDITLWNILWIYHTFLRWEYLFECRLQVMDKLTYRYWRNNTFIQKNV